MKLEAILNSKGENRHGTNITINGVNHTIYYEIYRRIERNDYVYYKIPNQR